MQVEGRSVGNVQYHRVPNACRGTCYHVNATGVHEVDRGSTSGILLSSGTPSEIYDVSVGERRP